MQPQTKIGGLSLITLVEAVGGLVELVVGEAPPGGLVGRRRLGVDDALLGDGLVRVAPAAEGQQPLQAPAPEVVHPPTQQCPAQVVEGTQLDDTIPTPLLL
jgi:hypothetical protein